MPSSSLAKIRILSLIPKAHKGVITELGSGFGSLAFPIAERCKNSHIKGFEISTVPYFLSKLRHSLVPYKNLTLKKRDFFKISLKKSSYIICYLYPGAMAKLSKKFQKELQPGTIIISNTFALPEFTPYEVYELKDLYRTKIYLYKV